MSLAANRGSRSRAFTLVSNKALKRFVWFVVINRATTNCCTASQIHNQQLFDFISFHLISSHFSIYLTLLHTLFSALDILQLAHCRPLLRPLQSLVAHFTSSPSSLMRFLVLSVLLQLSPGTHLLLIFIPTTQYEYKCIIIIIITLA